MKKLLSTILFLYTAATAAAADLPQVKITADSTLSARQKVTGHMTADGYDGPIGIKLRGIRRIPLQLPVSAHEPPVRHRRKNQ